MDGEVEELERKSELEQEEELEEDMQMLGNGESAGRRHNSSRAVAATMVSSWPGQGVAAVATPAAAVAWRRAAAATVAATRNGLLPRPSVSSHSRVSDEAFYAVVKTQKCRSKKNYNSEIAMTTI